MSYKQLIRLIILATCLLSSTLGKAQPDIRAAELKEVKSILRFVQAEDEFGLGVFNDAKGKDSDKIVETLGIIEKHIKEITRPKDIPALVWYSAGQLFFYYRQLDVQMGGDGEKLAGHGKRLLAEFFDPKSCTTATECSILARALREFVFTNPREVAGLLVTLDEKLKTFPATAIQASLSHQLSSLKLFAETLIDFHLISAEEKGRPFVFDKEFIESHAEKILEQIKRVSSSKAAIVHAYDQTNHSNQGIEAYLKLDQVVSTNELIDFLGGLRLYLFRFLQASPKKWLSDIDIEADEFIEGTYSAAQIGHALTMFSNHEMFLPSRDLWYQTTVRFFNTYLKNNAYFQFRVSLMRFFKDVVEGVISTTLAQFDLPQSLLTQEDRASKLFPLLYSTHYQTINLKAESEAFTKVFDATMALRKESFSDHLGSLQKPLKDMERLTFLMNVKSMRTWLELQCYGAALEGTSAKIVTYKFDLKRLDIDLKKVCFPKGFSNEVSRSVDDYLNERIQSDYTLEAFANILENPLISPILMVATSAMTNALVLKTFAWLNPKFEQWALRRFSYAAARSYTLEEISETGAKLTYGEYDTIIALRMAELQASGQFTMDVIKKLNSPFVAKIRDFMYHQVLSSVYFTAINRAMMTTLSLGNIPAYDFKKSVWKNVGGEIIWGTAIFTVSPWLGNKARNWIKNNKGGFAEMNTVQQARWQGLGHWGTDVFVFSAVPYAQRAVAKYAPWIEAKDRDKDPVFQGGYDMAKNILESSIMSAAFRKQDILSGMEVRLINGKKATLAIEAEKGDVEMAGETP